MHRINSTQLPILFIHATIHQRLRTLRKFLGARYLPIREKRVHHGGTESRRRIRLLCLPATLALKTRF